MRALAVLALGVAISWAPLQIRSEDQAEPEAGDAAALEVLVKRAEATPCPYKAKNPPPRITRGDGGEVLTLNLAGVELRAEEFEMIARLPALVGLSLSHTNVGDDHLKLFVDHPTLRGMNLNSTAVTDAGVEHLRRLPMLRALCLAQAEVSRDAIVALKSAHDENFDKRSLGIGYRPLEEVDTDPQSEAPETPAK